MPGQNPGSNQRAEGGTGLEKGADGASDVLSGEFPLVEDLFLRPTSRNHLCH